MTQASRATLINNSIEFIFISFSRLFRSVSYFLSHSMAHNLNETRINRTSGRKSFETNKFHRRRRLGMRCVPCPPTATKPKIPLICCRLTAREHRLDDDDYFALTNWFQLWNLIKYLSTGMMMMSNFSRQYCSIWFACRSDPSCTSTPTERHEKE